MSGGYKERPTITHRKMPNYNQAKIYKIVHNDMFYYGSTTLQYLSQRLSIHHGEIKKGKTSKLYTYLKDKDWKDVTIELVELYPCNTKDELTAKETKWIEPELNNPLCLNSRCALPTPSSIQKQKDKNSKTKSEKIICECGATIANGYKSQHIKMKSHIEKLGLTPINTKIRSVESLTKQKENAKKRDHTNITCDCGAIIKYGSLYLHKKSKEHLSHSNQ